MKTRELELMRQGIIPVESLSDYLEYFTPEEKFEIPIPWLLKAWENSNDAVRVEIKKIVKERTGGGFFEHLVLLKNLPRDSKMFSEVLSWTKKKAINLVRKAFLENFLENGLNFKPSF